jgi:hypothetical protein
LLHAHCGGYSSHDECKCQDVTMLPNGLFTKNLMFG